jgi:hypothetical protein
VLITTAYALSYPEVVKAVEAPPPPIALTATETSGNPVVPVNSVAGLSVGMIVYGPNITAGTTITSIDGVGVTITLSAAPTGNGSVTIYAQGASQLTQLIQAAQAAIESYIGWPTDQLAATEFYSGNNYPNLVLRRPFVLASPAPVVNLDAQAGYWGQASGAFPSNTLLTQGLDWALLTEGSYNGIANAGLLRYLGGNVQGFSSGFGGWWGIGGYGYGRSYLTPVGHRNPGWPIGQGNIKVTYTAGWLTGSAPFDLQQACVELVIFMKRLLPFGGMQLTAEGLSKYNYSLGMLNMADTARNAIAAAGELGTTRQLLTRYRDWNV